MRIDLAATSYSYVRVGPASIGLICVHKIFQLLGQEKPGRWVTRDEPENIALYNDMGRRAYSSKDFKDEKLQGLNHRDSCIV